MYICASCEASLTQLSSIQLSWVKKELFLVPGIQCLLTYMHCRLTRIGEKYTLKSAANSIFGRYYATTNTKKSLPRSSKPSSQANLYMSEYFRGKRLEKTWYKIQKYNHTVESLQSHFSLMHHVSLLQWTRLLPITRDLGSNPLGGLMWDRDSPVSVVSLQYRNNYFWGGI
jgi:hypothetical protein